ncbi:MAG: hypothetical protein C0490_05855, partial [Marivirga sp.]|nr:hypothetical protein [Marivirga sp.]
MVSIKRWVKEFFGLSHSQANGFIILIPLLAIIIFSEPVWQWYMSRKVYDSAADRAKLDSLILIWEKSRSESGDPGEKALPRTERFSFDPNHIAEEQLLALGFSIALSKRVTRYREK